MSSHHTIEAAITASLLAVTTITDSHEAQIFAFCGVGAFLCGFVGAAIAPTKSTRGLAMRWAVNFAFALTLAPALTVYVLSKLPELPLHTTACASGGIVGVFGVSMGIPIFRKIVKKKADEFDDNGNGK